MIRVFAVAPIGFGTVPSIALTGIARSVAVGTIGAAIFAIGSSAAVPIGANVRPNACAVVAAFTGAVDPIGGTISMPVGAGFIGCVKGMVLSGAVRTLRSEMLVAFGVVLSAAGSSPTWRRLVANDGDGFGS